MPPAGEGQRLFTANQSLFGFSLLASLQTRSRKDRPTYSTHAGVAACTSLTKCGHAKIALSAPTVACHRLRFLRNAELLALAIQRSLTTHEQQGPAANDTRQKPSGANLPSFLARPPLRVGDPAQGRTRPDQGLDPVMAGLQDLDLKAGFFGALIGRLRGLRDALRTKAFTRHNQQLDPSTMSST